MPRGISWSFNETEALIRLWADSATQTALRLNSRNRCIYEDIANQLQSNGITRSADQCQMRIKLLKKMYRQTNEATKRGEVFQQRPCPFYNEMHRIFSGSDDPNGSAVLSNSQSLLNDGDDDDQEEEENDDISDFERENHNEISSGTSTDDKITQAIHQLIEYQKQTETRWYKYLERQTSLELQRRQEDRAYQLQIIQLLSNVISTKMNSFPYQPSTMHNDDGSTEKVQVNQEDYESRAEKRKCSPGSSTIEKKAKLRQSLPSNFYSLLAQIHNINSTDEV